MAINDLFELTSTIIRGSTEINNRFFYIGDSADSDAEGLADAFINYIMPDWMAAVSANATMTEINVRNLTNLADVNLTTVSQAGGRIGERFADFVTIALELSPASPLVRVGRKALGPPSENDVAGGTLTPTYTAELDVVLADLAASILDVDLNSYSPVMFSPATIDRPFDVITSIVSAVFKRVSTQNSRKTW